MPRVLDRRFRGNDTWGVTAMQFAFSTALDVLQALKSARANSTIDWEAVLAEQYRSMIPSGRTIVDVGAHEGLHTIEFAKIAANVVCFEPIPYLADKLRTLFSAQPNIVVHEVALSNASGRSQFALNCTTPSESGLIARLSYRSSKLETIVVNIDCLDAYNLYDVDFIKLDCEGAEINILQGSKKTIMSSRPIISIEYGHAGYSVYGFQQEALLCWADNNGFIVSDLFGFPLQDRKIYDQCVDQYYWDYFLLPYERSAALAVTMRAKGMAILRRLLTAN
jgi:FkbM family methyltransferase